MPGKDDTSHFNYHDARNCPTFSGDDPSDYEEYRKMMTWWLLTQTEVDKDSGATTGRIVPALSRRVDRRTAEMEALAR